MTAAGYRDGYDEGNAAGMRRGFEDGFAAALGLDSARHAPANGAAEGGVLSDDAAQRCAATASALGALLGTLAAHATPPPTISQQQQQQQWHDRRRALERRLREAIRATSNGQPTSAADMAALRSDLSALL